MEKKNSIDVIVLNSHGVGQICRVKRLPRRGETLEAWNWRVEEDGGKGATVSVALGRLGISTGYIGKVGFDPWGDMGKKWMSESGVDTTFMYQDAAVSTGTGLIMVDDEGYNTIVDGDSACAALTEEETRLAIEAMKEAKIFITGFGMPFKKALLGAKIAKDEYQMLTICNVSPLPNEPMGNLSFLDFIILNNIEAKMLLNLPEDAPNPYQEIAQALKDKYQCKGVIITCGENGSVVLEENGTFSSIDPIKVTPVDTIGAGDGYLAAFAAGLINKLSIPDAATYANKYSAYKVTRQGTMTKKPGMGYPMKEDFDAFLQTL